MATSPNTDPFSLIVTQNPRMRDVIAKAGKFALLDAPLVIQGETGTGKDVIAKACHDFSTRRNKIFLAVNCAGIPGEDAETEMFGRRNKDGEFIGFFEYADGGTVLLDGVEELPLTLQAKLLRFLSDGTFRRVGEEEEHYADVRVICTAQQPLQHYVEQGKMRSDLFHRLNVLTLNLPLLRERVEDIEPLARQFIAEISEKLRISAPHFDAEFLHYLQQYPWLGNIRELYNALYRAVSLAKENHLLIEDLGLKTQVSTSQDMDGFVMEGETLDEIMGRFEAAVLNKFYAKYPSSRKLAARLGVSHTAIANKLRQYGIGKS
ncbi:GTP-binding proten HflX [Aggregatibacter actinomycetemcomitans serotype e str. SC1083]|uniref:GTP-binding proten HflX n=1 Tax=Aggregatibacter actinomycetemcomitans serotype e str. SC1083 TaxID=907488 RepID=G4A681_AGGAC|nr:sigma 54-interacting transcriptional regulator [Aggregatibacter actinomycetemcomitans]EGY34846.1 GTP-binding proten HflX [Aggregatibacter actinomycetemcomitans serotype e str. SC1083]KYK73459.1 transcriptional regulator [Aggregatibacter actinomycetemcomitans serotype e str. SA3096]KYK79453.1 transcriptional regulator [Aggregatibacter actinomycetemcomitans serotype e str. SC936]KYK94386.1 transcriptional regulator [Aggregatibacter actinomycetemcomitans serotype e str. ANH9776]TYB21781.1 AAA 